MSSPIGIEAEQSHSYRSIEESAVNVREVFGLSPSERADMAEIFEFLIDDYVVGPPERRVPMTYGVEDLTTEALTQWNPEEERIELFLSNSWYVALRNEHPRASFTVAHELGHAVLHTTKLIELGNLNLRSKAALHRGLKEHWMCRDTEWQANSFAAAFLMPFAGISKLVRATGRLNEGVVAGHFGVSFAAASVRLEIVRRGMLGSI